MLSKTEKERDFDFKMVESHFSMMIAIVMGMVGDERAGEVGLIIMIMKPTLSQ